MWQFMRKSCVKFQHDVWKNVEIVINIVTSSKLCSFIKKITVWVAMSSKGLIWQFFFEYEHGATTTVMTDIWRYYLASGDRFDKWQGSPNDDPRIPARWSGTPRVQTCAALDLKPLLHQVHQPQNTLPMECKQSGFQYSRLPLMGILKDWLCGNDLQNL